RLRLRMTPWFVGKLWSRVQCRMRTSVRCEQRRHPPSLFDDRVKLPAARFHDGIEPAVDILLEVRCVAVKIKRSLILVLLVKKKLAWILSGLVADIKQAAGLLARMFLQ